MRKSKNEVPVFEAESLRKFAFYASVSGAKKELRRLYLSGFRDAIKAAVLICEKRRKQQAASHGDVALASLKLAISKLRARPSK